MSRKPEYQEFLDRVGGRKPDPRPSDEETIATKQEIGWWKQLQVQKAIHAARYAIATPVQIHLLESKNIPVSDAARRRTKNFWRGR